MTTAVRASITKRQRGDGAVTAEDPPLPWAGRVPKPAMDADSFVDYGSGFLRKSCDSCVSSKRRCDGQDPCTRCLRRKKPCHYTERKKCGPRSGQKTTNKMRRLYTAETQLRRRYTAETQLQHDRANRAHHHRTASLGRRLSPDGVDDLHHSSAPLGRSPPLHSAPTLSAGELSGETTCVDHTDYSDNGLPPQQGLLRDESGSSWWSLDDQGAVPAGAAPARVEGAACEGGSWRPHEHQAHHQHQRGESVKAYDRSGGVGGNYGYNSSSGLEQRGLWSGVHSSSTAGTVSGSGGSAGESWEDDDSEEGLGRAEEEVAALLVGLGKTNEDFEGFSDDEDCCVGGDGENDGPGRDRMFSKPPTRHIAVSTSSQEWSV